MVVSFVDYVNGKSYEFTLYLVMIFIAYLCTKIKEISL